MDTITTALADVSTADWLKVIAVLVAAVGLFLNARQHRKANDQRRVDNVSDVFKDIYNDSELADIYYKIEYREFEYNNEFHRSDEEKKLDKLISSFDILAKKYYLGLVRLKDIELVSYEYLVIYQNPEVQEYFQFLDDWFDRRGIKNPPFDKFRSLGKVLEGRDYRA